MERYIDRSISTMRYSLAIMTGGAKQVSYLYQGDDEQATRGDFILTPSRKIVILTKDRKPIITKKWKKLNKKNI